MKLSQKRRKKRPLAPGAISSSSNQQTYKDLVFKWMLEAYPESISRTEIAARLHAHPQRVKTLIIQPLCEEERIFKWGQKTAPFERYMPNVKAPEYYEATGEKPPKMPNIDEQEFLRRVNPNQRKDPRNKRKKYPKKEAYIEEPGEQPKGKPEKELVETVVTDKAWSDLYEPVIIEEDDNDDDDEDETEATEFFYDGEDDIAEGEFEDDRDDDDITFSDVEEDNTRTNENSALDKKTKRRNGEKFPNGLGGQPTIE